MRLKYIRNNPLPDPHIINSLTNFYNLARNIRTEDGWILDFEWPAILHNPIYRIDGNIDDFDCDVIFGWRCIIGLGDDQRPFAGFELPGGYV